MAGFMVYAIQWMFSRKLVDSSNASEASPLVSKDIEATKTQGAAEVTIVSEEPSHQNASDRSTGLLVPIFASNLPIIMGS